MIYRKSSRVAGPILNTKTHHTILLRLTKITLIFDKQKILPFNTNFFK